MNFLNNIWTALTTENANLTSIISFPLVIIEAFVFMMLFTTVLKIKACKREKIIYIIIYSLLYLLINFVIPKPFSNIISLIAMPIVIILIFKVNILKALVAEFLPVVCITILEIIITKLCFSIFDIPYNIGVNIPICKICVLLIIYGCIFGICKLIKHFNFSITFFNNISKKNKNILIINIIIALIVVFMQIYLIVYYYSILPIFIIIINLICLFSYFSISIFYLIKTMKLEKVEEDLVQEQMSKQALQQLYDNIRAFKHDFGNILFCIGGYASSKNLDGLNKYYEQLMNDYHYATSTSALSPESINSPAVYNVLANKYYKADLLHISIVVDSFIDYTKLNMEVYEFARILGILMDNAIEASKSCDKKLIKVSVSNFPAINMQLLKIQNTYSEKNIDLKKIYEKGFSTKPNNTGLGLWEVNKIVNKNDNLLLTTDKDDTMFIQKLEIYEKGVNAKELEKAE